MKYSITLLSLVVLFASCRKDQAEPISETAPLPLSESAPQIVIGDSTGMKMKNVNYTLYYPDYYTNQLNIPIWHTDTNDLTAISAINHGPGPWASYGLSITSNSTLKFRQIENGFITYEVLDSFYNNTTPVQEVYVEGYTCNQGQSTGVVHEMSDQPMYLNEGDIISIDDYFSQVVSLIRPEVYNDPYHDFSNPDTTVISGISTNVSCNNIDVSPTYIGLNMDVQGVQKLGWIKISTVGGNGIAVSVDQIAIQR